MREGDANHRQVLVVDDEEDIRTGIAQVLAMIGLKVATAAGGGAALEMLARSPYAIVLLDIRMPDLDGMEVLKRIRQDHPASPPFKEHLPSFISQRLAEFQVFIEEDHTLEDMEKRYIQFILHRTKGRRQDAARILGINRKTLSLKIEKYKLRVNW